jgi:hypothetical protein
MLAACAIPADLMPPASNARLLYDAHRFEETVAFCQKEIGSLEKEIPARAVKRPVHGDPAAPQYQYFGLTCVLVNALAELGRWKAAKEALGRYRMHFPRDPWGFTVGAKITRLDPDVKDHTAVARAAELLETEGRRLEAKVAK